MAPCLPNRTDPKKRQNHYPQAGNVERHIRVLLVVGYLKNPLSQLSFELAVNPASGLPRTV